MKMGAENKARMNATMIDKHSTSATVVLSDKKQLPQSLGLVEAPEASIGGTVLLSWLTEAVSSNSSLSSSLGSIATRSEITADLVQIYKTTRL